MGIELGSSCECRRRHYRCCYPQQRFPLRAWHFIAASISRLLPKSRGFVLIQVPSIKRQYFAAQSCYHFREARTSHGASNAAGTVMVQRGEHSEVHNLHPNRPWPEVGPCSNAEEEKLAVLKTARNRMFEKRNTNLCV